MNKIAKNEVNLLPRRSFFAKSIGVSASALFLSSQVDAECPPPEYIASPADSLLLYLDYVGQAEAYLLRSASTILAEANAPILEMFERLYAEVERFLKAVRDSKARPHAQLMHGLTENARSSAQFIQAAAVPAERRSQAVLASLGIVVEQLDQTTKDLFPDGEMVLSREATRILRNIIDLVQQMKPLHETAVLAGKNVLAENRKNEERFKRIRTSMLTAAVIANADSAPSASTGAAGSLQPFPNKLGTVDFHINSALSELTSLSSDSSSPVNILVALLQGIQKWIARPARIALSSVALDEKQNHGPSVEPASFDLAVAADPPRVPELLNRYCKPASPRRRMTCVILAMPIWVLYPDPKDPRRLELVTEALRLFPCPDGGSLPAEFAKALASITL